MTETTARPGTRLPAEPPGWRDQLRDYDYPGVGVEFRDGYFRGRFTVPRPGRAPKRDITPAVCRFTDPVSAWREAQNCQRLINQADPRSAESRSMRFDELVTKFRVIRATQGFSPATENMDDSLFGNIDGIPACGGRRAAISARFALLAYFNTMALDRIGPQTVMEYRAAMLAAGLGPSMIGKRLAMLKWVMQVAVDNGFGGQQINPVLAVAKLKTGKRADAKVKARKANRKAIWIDDWAALYEQFRGEGVQLFTEFTWYTGARFEEGSAIRVCDLFGPNEDPEGIEPLEHAWIRQAVLWPGTKRVAIWEKRLGQQPTGRRWMIVDLPKDGEDRKVTLSADLLTRLRDYAARNNLTGTDLLFGDYRLRLECDGYEAPIEAPDRGEPYVSSTRFLASGKPYRGYHGVASTYGLGCRCESCTLAKRIHQREARRRAGKPILRAWQVPGVVEAISASGVPNPLNYSWWRGTWNVAVAAAGLPGKPGFHELRHSSITIADAFGCPLNVLMAEMGHANPMTTLGYKRDARLLRPERRDAMDRATAQWHSGAVDAAPQGPTPAVAELAKLDAAHTGLWNQFGAVATDAERAMVEAMMSTIVTQRTPAVDSDRPNLRVVS